METPASSTPPVPPPNGAPITTADLYKTLYQMDQRLAERDTSLINMVGTLRADFSTHTKDGHPFTQNAEVIKEEIRLDAKKAGVAAAALAAVVALSGLVSSLLDKVMKF